MFSKTQYLPITNFDNYCKTLKLSTRLFKRHFDAKKPNRLEEYMAKYIEHKLFSISFMDTEKIFFFGLLN